MEALKLAGMAIVKDLSTEEEFRTLENFLLVDPKDITHHINFWRSEKTNATEAEQVELQELIDLAKNHLKNQLKLTCQVYSFGTEVKNDIDTTPIEKKDKVEPIPGEQKEIIDPSKQHLHVVKDDEPPVESQDVKTLREKYSALIKKVNIQALTTKIKELLSTETTFAEGVELATFILGQGLYQGKKVKKWNQKEIENFLSQNSPAPAQQEEEVDFYKTYACYLGENAMSLGQLKAEVKFLLNSPETIEKAIEVATFILTEGLYIEDKVEKYTPAQVETFINEVREDLKLHPIDLTPEKKDEGPSSKIEDKPAEKVEEKKTPIVEEVKDYDINMSDLYIKLNAEIINKENGTEEDAKSFIFDFINKNKVQNLVSLYGLTESEETTKLREKAYTRFFFGFVKETMKMRELEKVDVTEHLKTFIGTLIEEKEKSLTKAVKEAKTIFSAKGENVNLLECKEIVYNITEEHYPEYYAELIKDLPLSKIPKKKEPKIAIVEDVKNFEEQHPEIWEQSKTLEYLDDVITMAKELEKTQDFRVVSEMITHTISSGKIKKENLKKTDEKAIEEFITWDKAQIELWINTIFKPVEAEVTNPTASPAVTETKETPVNLVSETATQENNEEQSPGQTDKEAGSDSANSAQENIVDDDIKYAKNLKIPEENKDFKGLYAADKQGFYEGVGNIIKALTTAGKDKKEITHILADKIKELSTNDELRNSCFVRQFKRDEVTKLYSKINKIADAQGVEGWKIE